MENLKTKDNLWPHFLVTAFLVCFSGLYLFFWIEEMLSGHYNQKNFLIDLLLFIGVNYFAIIPLVRILWNKWSGRKTSMDKNANASILKPGLYSKEQTKFSPNKEDKYLTGTVISVNKNWGVMYCEENKREYTFFFKDILSTNRSLIIEGLRMSFFVADSLVVTSAPSSYKEEMENVAKDIIILENKNIFLNLYTYSLGRMMKSWLFYIYPILVLINPYNKPITSLIVIPLYIFLLPALITWLKYKEMNIKK